MKSRIGCLVVDADPESIRLVDAIGRNGAGLDVRWRAASFATGMEIARKHLPEMAIVGMGRDPDPAIEAIASMAREFPALYLLVLSERGDSDVILQAMRAGAHDFLCKPVKEAELCAAIGKALKLRTRREPAASSGKVISLFSNKGGNGTTTIAANLADALVRYHGKKVVVVDLVLANGDVTMFFNANPTYTILDLAKSAGKADYDFLHSLLVRHDTGVYILADPPMIEDAEQISAAQVKEVLATLKSMFDVIIVDTPHQFDDRTLTALEMSDTVLLVTLLNLPSLKNTQKCLELFGRIGLLDSRVRLVLSRYLPNDEIPKESIEGIMNCPIFFAVPNDYPAVISSVNRGKLLREIAPDKEITKSFREMAERLLGPPAKKDEPARKRGFLEKIFRPERSS